MREQFLQIHGVNPTHLWDNPPLRTNETMNVRSLNPFWHLCSTKYSMQNYEHAESHSKHSQCVPMKSCSLFECCNKNMWLSPGTRILAHWSWSFDLCTLSFAAFHLLELLCVHSTLPGLCNRPFSHGATTLTSSWFLTSTALHNMANLVGTPERTSSQL